MTEDSAALTSETVVSLTMIVISTSTTIAGDTTPPTNAYSIIPLSMIPMKQFEEIDPAKQMEGLAVAHC